jgi:methylated-DNA-[protein]-cysteine S-methyltransferase
MRPPTARGDSRPPRLRCAPLETPIGGLWICVSDRGLYEIGRDAPSDSSVEPDAGAAIADVVDQLLPYFAGTRRSFDLPLDLAGVSAFDRSVWRAAREIPYGATASYGELALLAGHPGAARAVGGSMARCRLFPIVPCHRVIHADGSIGGWGGETCVKRWLLDLEATSSSSPRRRRPRTPWRAPAGPG